MTKSSYEKIWHGTKHIVCVTDEPSPLILPPENDMSITLHKTIKFRNDYPMNVDSVAIDLAEE